MLDAFGPGRRIVLAASTHPGEDAWLAGCIRAAAADALPVIVPRHAERRAEVREELEQRGFQVVQRSQFHAPVATADRRHVFLIDSTGELRDWTAHADAVIIGKSFHSTGGQNPGEAILAGKPLICGPHMENFEPLAARLVAAGGCLSASDEASLEHAIRTALDSQHAAEITRNAARVLATHDGATRRVIDLLTTSRPT
jgi:3-deoxy-D-manno-octulosonic-acid transferase